MSETINHTLAATKLLECLTHKQRVSADLEALLRMVICGSHKTYRYVLVTGLLAKSVNSKVNALCLQAGAPLDGAYDARSLCHKVVVPFEREYLSNALGGSNEPFLNKPARFTHLSSDNAVRDGNDREILNTLISIFERINKDRNGRLATKCLSNCFLLLEKIISNNELLHTVHAMITPDLIDIYTFISRFIEKSYEGETCAIVVGTVEKQFYSCLKGEYRIIAHKVNESGASSKEIGDIDVYENETYFYSIEVKDKAFTIYDIEHAFNKMIENKAKRGSFIYGPRATFDHEQVKITLFNYEKKKFVTLFMGILPYVRLVLFQTPNVEKDNFLQLLLDTAFEINAKKETIEWIHSIIHDLFRPNTSL